MLVRLFVLNCAVRRRSFAWLGATVDSGTGDGDDDAVIGRLNFLRCRILFTSVSLVRLAAVTVGATLVGSDVVGMYVGRDRLRMNGDAVVFRTVDSVPSLISFDWVELNGFCCGVDGCRRRAGRYCGRTFARDRRRILLVFSTDQAKHICRCEKKLASANNYSSEINQSGQNKWFFSTSTSVILLPK